MKELLAIGAMALALTTGSITAGTARTSAVVHQRGSHISVARIQALDIKAKDAINVKRMEALRNNGLKVDKTISKLKTHVGKTWYVFSGNTPAGWDCSGLTMWFYEQLDVNLEHRASKQQTAGKATKNPKPGDLVVFEYKGYKSAYHVGIYIGNGKMIHAPKHGHRTMVESVNQFAGNYSKVIYRSIVDMV
jgi:cell wall-associated NlpC family hydrolase